MKQDQVKYIKNRIRGARKDKVTRIQRLFSTLEETPIKGHSISTFVLLMIFYDHQVTLKELGELINKPPSSTSSQVHKLKRLGLIDKIGTIKTQSRPESIFTLSKTGEKLIDLVRAALHGGQRRMRSIDFYANLHTELVAITTLKYAQLCVMLCIDAGLSNSRIIKAVLHNDFSQSNQQRICELLSRGSLDGMYTIKVDQNVVFHDSMKSYKLCNKSERILSLILQM